MNTEIFHEVNASLFFNRNNTGILIDGIHAGESVGMSKMDAEWNKMREEGSGIFEKVDGIIFTHLHSDHFWKQEVDAFLDEKDNRIKTYGRCWEKTNVSWEMTDEGLRHFRVKGAEIYAKKTMHDGEKYRMDPHESFLLKFEDEVFFIAGDSELLLQDVQVFLAYVDHVNAVFLNLYQIKGEEGVVCIRMLNAEHVFLNHLPFAKDDVWNYLPMARQVVRWAKSQGVKVEIMEPMSWIAADKDKRRESNDLH